MATSVSASRWRTAWNMRSAGRTGRARARASRASSSIVRGRADQLVADGELGERDAADSQPVDRRGGRIDAGQVAP